MKRPGSNTKLFGVSTKLIFFLHMISFLYISYSKYLRIIGLISTLCIATIFLIYVFKNNNIIYLNSTLIIGVLFVFLFTLSLPIGFGERGISLWIQQTFLILYISIFSSLKIEYGTLYKLIKFFNKLFLSILLFSLISEFISGSNILLNFFSPTLYKLLFALSFFNIIESKRRTFSLLLYATIFIYLGERSIGLVYITILFYMIIFNFKNENRKIQSIYIIISLILIFVFPSLYVGLSKTSYSTHLNQWSIDLFGERFFSGRNIIWDNIFIVLNENWFFGLGINNTFITTTNYLSVHNLYMYLLLQGGYSLLVTFAIFLFSIFNRLLKYFHNLDTRFSAAFFMGILVLVSFDLLLLANNIVVSLHLWLTVGVVLALNNSRKEMKVDS